MCCFGLDYTHRHAALIKIGRILKTYFFDVVKTSQHSLSTIHQNCQLFSQLLLALIHRHCDAVAASSIYWQKAVEMLNLQTFLRDEISKARLFQTMEDWPFHSLIAEVEWSERQIWICTNIWFESKTVYVRATCCTKSTYNFSQSMNFAITVNDRHSAALMDRNNETEMAKNLE